MFGYIICNKSGLSKEELDRYQSVYCGLCRALGDRFGQKERMSLSFDMAFLALLLLLCMSRRKKANLSAARCIPYVRRVL